MLIVNKKAILVAALMTAMFPSGLLALCCTPNSNQVVQEAKKDVELLKQYNGELDSVIRNLRSTVALSMAINVEKERQAADIAAMRRVMGLKADATSLIVRKKIIAIDSEILSLSKSFGEEINEEVKAMESVK